MLQLDFTQEGGRIQIFSPHLLARRASIGKLILGAGGGDASYRAHSRGSIKQHKEDQFTGGLEQGTQQALRAAKVVQLMFPMEGQLNAWRHDIDRLMASNKVSLRPDWTPLKIWVGTWNAANLDPPFDTLPLAAWLFGGDPNGTPTCDIYAVGFQELGGGGGGVNLGGGGGGGTAKEAAAKAAAEADEKASAALNRCSVASAGGPVPAATPAATDPHLHAAAAAGAGKKAYRRASARTGKQGPEGGGVVLTSMAAALQNVLGSEFTLVEAMPMFQIQLFVFVRTSHLHHAGRVACGAVPTFRTAYSKAGTYATPKMLAMRKGGVGITLSLGRTTFCFVTAHLAAHQGEKGQMLERNRDSVRILQNLLGDGRDACTCFDHLFVFGDLNYRLGTTVDDPRDLLVRTIPTSTLNINSRSS